MNAHAVVLEQPLQLQVRELPLIAATSNDLVVDILYTVIDPRIRLRGSGGQ